LFSKFAARLPSPLRAVLAALLFLVVWAFLNANFNLRSPHPNYQPPLWYLLPSLDACVLLAVFALLGWRGWRIPAWATVGLAVLVTVARLYRFADGLMWEESYRPVNLTIDLPLVPDLAQFLRSTVPFPRLLIGALAIAAVMAAYLVVIYATLVVAERFLASGWRARGLFAGLLLPLAALGSTWAADRSPELHTGLFGRSVVPLFIQQVRSSRDVAALGRVKAAEIRQVQERLQQTPSDLKALQGADVMIFLVESYGSVLFHDRTLMSLRCPNLEDFGSAISARGFAVASNFINSTTYGGGSWMPQTTLATGISVRDGIEYALVRTNEPPPKTLAEFFKEAGYRTVLAAAGGLRRWPEGVVQGFDHRYYAAEMEYQGPPFGWVTMPDEYVIDVMHRKEVATAKGPLFLQNVMISSHAPWSMVPLPVNDWSLLDHGRLYHDSHVARFPINWNNLDKGAPAYAYSLCYDFDVLKRYITERITRDTFMVIFGDHQPSPVLTNGDPSWAVPIHVISRNRAIIERFNEAGYSPGMIPPSTGTVAGLETLMPQLLELLSRPPLAPRGEHDEP
jgi:hypothetical protein